MHAGGDRSCSVDGLPALGCLSSKPISCYHISVLHVLCIVDDRSVFMLRGKTRFSDSAGFLPGLAMCRNLACRGVGSLVAMALNGPVLREADRSIP